MKMSIGLCLKWRGVRHCHIYFLVLFAKYTYTPGKNSLAVCQKISLRMDLYFWNQPKTKITATTQLIVISFKIRLSQSYTIDTVFHQTLFQFRKYFN